MIELSSRQHYKLLGQIVLGLTPFLILGLIFIAIFRWGEMLPFIISLFVPNEFSYLLVTLLGLIVGAIIVLIVVGLIIITKIELPQTEGAEIINKIMKTPSGIAVSALGGGFIEEFFFRGVLIGMFIGYHQISDWAVIVISSFLFWIIHIPQYKGVYLAYVLVFINGLLFALLFYFTGSLIPSMIAHAIYNLGIGIYFIKKS
ncbi:CPBP family intramembrane glutamic endopeptidase [Peribacillus muralis]|uniref:CPBP family intramembrane glutamic endopeptidase n=1 Tax=Peribacillus muralis TaxID=264697 RepID=UPI003D05D469